MIAKGERVELRALIKQQFKVLAAEVAHREAELVSDLDAELAARYATEDRAWADAEFLMMEAAREANRKANDVMRGLLGDRWPAGSDRVLVEVSLHQARRARGATEKAADRKEGVRKIEVQVKRAQVALARQEVDLLTKLASEGLESAEARDFLRTIPTAAELVPSVRLLELEQQFGGEHR